MSYLSQFFAQITGLPHLDERGKPTPKIVFLHGIMGFGINWRRIAREFEATHQVLCFDQRGHGRSFHASPGQYSPKNYAIDLLKILDELDWREPIDLVGHSMGGRVALEFIGLESDTVGLADSTAGAGGERAFTSAGGSDFLSNSAGETGSAIVATKARVRKLVLEDIGPDMNPSAVAFLYRLLDEIPVPFASKREARQYFTPSANEADQGGDFFRTFFGAPSIEGLAQFLNANITEDSEKRGIWRFDKEGLRETLQKGSSEDRWASVQNLKVPTLLVRGENSRDLTRDVYNRVLKTNVAQAIRGVEIPGSGHWVHSDKPDEFIRVVKEFLR